ncbi:MAG: aminotransferase class I/II-fold pyridoxal phosphate-dependent enzyme, partial [Bacteroidales bacterium]|nr:aminotransferase class I/II-fold pyridoxal phosphate-dependent enzyme [Bacteroidales bacterium]
MSQVKKNHFPVNLNLNVRGLESSATLAINEKSKQMIDGGREVFRLGLGQSPFPVPDEVAEALRRNAHQKDYLPVKGLMPLRESIARFNLRMHKVDDNPDDIIIGPGSKELIFILQLVYYGDLIIPTPSWVSYAPQARIIGRNVNWVPTFKDNDLRLSPDMLEEICKKDPDKPRIAILNYPANPTGVTYPIERLKRLAEVARKYRVILVSDEIYGLLHHNNQHVSVARYYPEGTIISNGLSKWCGAGGWRLGFFSFPPGLRWLLNAMTVVASETFTATSAPIQHAAVTAFEGGPFMDQYLVKTRKVLKAILKYITHRFDKLNITYPHPQGAFYIFPDFGFYSEKLKQKGIFTGKELCERILDETGVAMLPGADFGRPPEEFSARIAYVDFDGAEAMETA